jgi:plasmid stabilization system protein ParE
MTLPVSLTPAAQADYDTSHEWYENRKSGAGRAFGDAVQKVFDRIAANPLLHAQVFGDVRRAVVPKYPFVILYIPEVTHIAVISVFHTSRDPSEWQSRV